jgi:hypothetical protein
MSMSLANEFLSIPHGQTDAHSLSNVFSGLLPVDKKWPFKGVKQTNF